MKKSYWQDFGQKNKKQYPKLQENLQEEITIIGGGLTGLTTAYYLTKAGKKVALLEKNEICSSTSGNTTGKITSQHGLFYNYLLQTLGKKDASLYLQANEQAIKNIENIIKEENIECDFEIQDSYVFAQTEDGMQKIKNEYEALEYIGFKNCELQETLQIPISPKALGAIKFKNQAQFNPVLYSNNLARKIEQGGSKIFENTKVADIKRRANDYEIITENNKINSKIVVIATHYPIINVPGFYFLKMYQETSYIIAIETKTPLFTGMYISAENCPISLRTAKDGDKRLVLVGGMNHKTGSKIDLKKSYQKLEEIAKQMYPGCKILYHWNAQDCVPIDKIPYIGEFSSLWPNVYVATGYKKWGMTSSNIAANIISDKILKKENPYEKIFTSTRLKPIKNYKEMGNMLKEVAYSEIINKIKLTDEHVKDIKQNEAKIIDIEGKKVGIYRDKNGKLYAIKPYCSHLKCELSWNNLENTWDCPCHGSRFTIEGKSIYDPSIKDLEVYYIDK